MPFWLEGFFLDNPLRRAWFRPDFVLQLAGPLEGRTVGEVGVGTGFVSAALAAAVGPQGRLQGIDQGSGSVAAAAARLGRLGLRGDLQCADARSLPWADRSVDVVVMVAMLGEVAAASRPRVLDEVRRVLSPDGTLVVVEYWPDPHFLTPAALRAQLASGGFRVKDARRRWLQHGVRAYTAPEWVSASADGADRCP